MTATRTITAATCKALGSVARPGTTSLRSLRNLVATKAVAGITTVTEHPRSSGELGDNAPEGRDSSSEASPTASRGFLQPPSGRRNSSSRLRRRGRQQRLASAPLSHGPGNHLALSHSPARQRSQPISEDHQSYGVVASSQRGVRFKDRLSGNSPGRSSSMMSNAVRSRNFPCFDRRGEYYLH